MADDWQKVDGAGDDDNTKECQYCGETIKKAAIKCRHCGEGLKKRKKRGPGAAVRKTIDDAANLSLIMAILGILVCPLTLIVAIIKGNEAKRMALRNRMPVPGGASAGIMIGWIFGILNLVSILLVVVLFAVAAGAAASQGR